MQRAARPGQAGRGDRAAARIGALRLIDFTADGRELDETDAEKIPPLLAIRSERLARGLMRVVPEPGEPPVTVDAITTPLLGAATGWPVR